MKKEITVRPFPPLRKGEFIQISAEEAKSIGDMCERMHDEIERLELLVGEQNAE